MARTGEQHATVLVVDDESSIRNALRRVFLDEPWDMLFAEGAQEGIDLIEKHDVDLILSDFRMPGMDGVEFLKRCKEIRPDSMRMVLSGYADINVIVSALNEGEVYRFLAKPWNEDELRHNIKKALEHHMADRENRRLSEELRQFNAELEKKVETRTRELVAKNRSLRFAHAILELVPMPVLGVNGAREVVFANAKAREILGGDLVGHTAPDIFEPELSGAILRAIRENGQEGPLSLEGAHRVLPMVIDGEPVGALILTHENDPLDLEQVRAEKAFDWSVVPS